MGPGVLWLLTTALLGSAEVTDPSLVPVSRVLGTVAYTLGGCRPCEQHKAGICWESSRLDLRAVLSCAVDVWEAGKGLGTTR